MEIFKKENNNDQKDETPKTGVNNTSIYSIMFSIIPAIGIVGIKNKFMKKD